MADEGLKTINIKVETETDQFLEASVEEETGKVLKVMNKNGEQLDPVTQADFEKIYQADGFKYVGTILHSKNSPGCIYVIFGGVPYRICW